MMMRSLLLQLPRSGVRGRPTFLCCRQQWNTAPQRLRRKRDWKGTIPVAPAPVPLMKEPHQHGEETIDAYLEKASLSPWVPLPDAAARKIFDLSSAGPSDVHVDLGCGDGRVNFHAIDFGVGSSVGIDIDDTILEVARTRLSKRHPPPDLQFVLADLEDFDEPAWEHVKGASLITMFFAKEALERFRPLLELKLVGKECRIVTAGYEMPGWESSVEEVVLGTRLHLYEWGKTHEEDGIGLFAGDDFLKAKPEQLSANALEGTKFAGSKIIDHTGKHIIRGFNPAIFSEEEDDDDDDWDDWEDDETEEVKVSKTKNT